MTTAIDMKILISAVLADVISVQKLELMAALARRSESIAIAQSFGSSQLVRQLRLVKDKATDETLLRLDPQQGNQVFYQSQLIGQKQVLYKSPLPGELQARLAIESITDRFLEYLQKVHQIVTLTESDRHVQVFIPNQPIKDFKTLWDNFLTDVAFSASGNSKFQLPDLIQTFILMLNSITLSGRGFSTLDVPILTQEQSNVLAAWYLQVIHNVEKRQIERQKQIDNLQKEIALIEEDTQDYKTKQKDLQAKEAMQIKEEQKYNDYFQKSFGKTLEEQNTVRQELKTIEIRLNDSKLTKTEQNKLQKQKEKLLSKVIFSQVFIQGKLESFKQSQGNPFEFIEIEKNKNPEKFTTILNIANKFNKTATDQINSTRGDIFTQCITEMYRLLENEPNEPLPQPLLARQPVLSEMRSPGDDSKEFCYSCGVKLDPKTAKWQVLRFMFERPSQRRQSASSEGRPHICALCSALAFASPLKVTDESIILRLEPADKNTTSELKVKDYIRMMTNKELHLSAGRHIVLASDRTNKGDLASKKLGQVQYALAKVTSIFPLEVFNDFRVFLIIQASQPIHLLSRHLIFIKGLIESYNQTIIISDKEINMALGEAIRYIEQDLPYLAEYTLTKIANTSKQRELERVREVYWVAIQNDLQAKGDYMNSDSQRSKRGKLYGDVAALTGLTYAFADSLEFTAKQANKGEDYVEREVTKLIEEVDDAVAFCYYATLGDKDKTRVEAKLLQKPENYFIYERTQKLLNKLEILGREEKDEAGKTWLKLYADDVLKAYKHFAENGYSQDKEWKELTYQLKLSLYTRFPELVRKQKSTRDK